MAEFLKLPSHFGPRVWLLGLAAFTLGIVEAAGADPGTIFLNCVTVILKTLLHRRKLIWVSREQ